MTIPALRYARAETVEHAVALAAEYGEDAAYYHGGTELAVLLKLGLTAIDVLVDLKHIPGLAEVRSDEAGVRIGAGAVHAAIAADPVVREKCPVFARVEGQLANVRVRNVGTIGGNLSFGEPHSDPLTLLWALDAELALISPAGPRRLPLSEFLLGPFETAALPGELVTAVVVPAASLRRRLAYRRLVFRERPAVTVATALDPDSSPPRLRCTVGSLHHRPQTFELADLDIGGPHRSEALAERIYAECTVTEDADGDAEYKRHLAATLCRRMVPDMLAGS